MPEEHPVFEDHIGLLKSVVSSFERSCRPEDSELFPVACMCLMKAISTFDPSKSKFSYWATKIIRNGIVKEIRKNAAPVSLSPLEDDPSAQNFNMPLELIPLLTETSEQDTPTESENRRMLVRHFLDGVSMAEIARELGFTREGVRQKVKRAIECIRKRHRDLLDNHPFWLVAKSEA